MRNSDILSRNVEALARKRPEDARRIIDAQSSDIVRFLSSRSGSIVPAIRVSGSERALHSLFNPDQEAERTEKQLDRNGDPGFIIAIGLGGGFHLKGLLRRVSLHRALIIESDFSLVRSLFERVDYVPFLADDRFNLIIDPNPYDLTRAIVDFYYPLISRGITTILLRAYTDVVPDRFEQIYKSIGDIINSVRNDTATQTNLGIAWLRNSLYNLPLLATSSSSFRPASEAIVTGAGPSLESAYPVLKKRDRGTIIVATDTSYPALIAEGVHPDIVLTIDAQIISYHHYLCANKDTGKTTFVFDLATSPTVARLSDRRMFVLTDHPFSRYISSAAPQLPYVDVSGGNVTYAAVDFARRLGIQKVTVVGADFAYPDGKPYARGTYAYPYFAIRAGRRSPIVTSVMDFVLRSQDGRRVADSEGITYIPAKMDRFRSALERIVNDTRPAIFQTSSEPFGIDSMSILKSYASLLSRLPEPEQPLTRFFSDLPAQKLALYYTLFPSALRFLRDTGSALEALISSKNLAVSITDNVIRQFS